MLDTSTALLRRPLTPTNTPFTPIGHAGLEWKPKADKELGLPASGVVWAVTLYVSSALRGRGVGGSAMTQLESIAAREPLGARVMVLGTQKGESQSRGEGRLEVPVSLNICLVGSWG
ncbi:GNAT family N-acetyltransferase [Candidatus Bathyarchaeota archaeon]|nr:GNAT family N-acetyltransferase [Candidatus Bathyarchaeota archaeon]